MVVYNHVPDRASLEAAVHHSDGLVLIDNGSSQEVRDALVRFRSDFPDRVRLRFHDENLGLSRAYNQAIRELVTDGYYWFYLLDHDARFGGEFFTQTRAAWSLLESSGVRVGVVVPIVTDDPRYLGGRAGFRRSFSFLQNTMTSGILTNADVFGAVGGFEERLFVEVVDFDFTSRAHRLGYRNCLVNRVLIVQEFGEPVPGRSQAVRVAEFLLRMRGFARVGIGNSNMLRTHLAHYPPGRLRRLYASLRWIVAQGHPWRAQARFTIVLDRLEEWYIRILLRHTSERRPDPSRLALRASVRDTGEGRIQLDAE